MPTLIAEGNPAAHRIVIGHPFNPPELMPLVEMVPGQQTSPEIVERAAEVYASLGKLPIKLKKELPGFVGNRLQKGFNEQATYLVQQGVIEPQDLDELVKASSVCGGRRSARSRAAISGRPRRDAAPRRPRRVTDDVRERHAGPGEDGCGHLGSREGVRHRRGELRPARRAPGPPYSRRARRPTCRGRRDRAEPLNATDAFGGRRPEWR